MHKCWRCGKMLTGSGHCLSWLYSLKEMNVILDRVSERHWAILWKLRKVLITKLTGQNGSGELNQRSSGSPLWRAAIYGFFNHDPPHPYPSPIPTSPCVTLLKSQIPGVGIWLVQLESGIVPYILEQFPEKAPSLWARRSPRGARESSN